MRCPSSSTRPPSTEGDGGGSCCGPHFRTATRHRLVRHAVETGVVVLHEVISIVERSGVAARERAGQALPLSSWRPELPAVRHHSHTFPTRSYTRKGRANTFAWSANRRPNRRLKRSACDRASGCRRVLRRPATAIRPRDRYCPGGTIPRGQRRPRSRIAKPAGANRTAATAPTEAATHDDGVEITESGNTGAPPTSVNEVKAKGQQTDLVLLEAYLELDAGAIQLVGSWRLLPRPAAPRIDSRARCVTRSRTDLLTECRLRRPRDDRRACADGSA